MTPAAVGLRLRARPWWWLAAAAVAVLAAACKRAPPPPPATPGAHCEVELGGQVQQVVSGNRAIAIYVSNQDCAQPQARTIARTMATGDGQFFAEVWVPCDTTLTVCAAVEARAPYDGEPKPTRHWGKLDRSLLARGTGEIEFFGLKWSMQDQPERTFAAPQPLLVPPVGHTPRVP